MTETTTPELLPCPFCNGEACINSEPNRVWRRVQCTGCETEQADSHSLEEAVALWNTRAALAGIEAAVLAERERCAALCESISAEDGIGSYRHEDDYAVGAVNALIRSAIEIREGVKS